MADEIEDELPKQEQPRQLPWHDITAANFIDKGKQFMIAQGGHGFVVVRDGDVHIPYHATAPRYLPSPREWGAWRSYRKAKYLSCAQMDKMGYYTVPSRWPHWFDADWPEHRSVDAANRYQDAIERKQLPPPKPGDLEPWV